ncbi:MAG: secretin and TonB N-terminal domain-containing protein [Pseudomonadota bacterium]
MIAADGSATIFETQDVKAPPGLRMNFDLPAQPLAAALEAYGAASGRQVVYEGGLAMGRQSTAVKGIFTPEEALRRLLAGTGLDPRYMAADGFVLVLKPIRHRNFLITTTPRATLNQFYGLIQAGLRRSVCADARAWSGGYRVAVGVWIGTTGVVTHAALLDTTGNSGLDAAIERDVNGARINAAPPAGFAQPVVMVITSEAMRECAGDQTEDIEPVKVGQ